MGLVIRTGRHFFDTVDDAGIGAIHITARRHYFGGQKYFGASDAGPGDCFSDLRLIGVVLCRVFVLVLARTDLYWVTQLTYVSVARFQGGEARFDANLSSRQVDAKAKARDLDRAIWELQCRGN